MSIVDKIQSFYMEVDEQDDFMRVNIAGME